MANPWLKVPLGDYEGHMKCSGVEQLGVLSELFAEVLGYCRPASVAILGVAGGNGLEHVDGAVTHRVLGLDVNPAYLEAVRRRFGAVRGLELHCVDLAERIAAVEAVELVHAALVFEHAGAGRCLENAMALVAAGGALSVVLQLPGEPGANVGASPFSAVQGLREGFALIQPVRLQEALEAGGFRLRYESRRELPGGKGFWLGVFRRVPGSGVGG